MHTDRTHRDILHDTHRHLPQIRPARPEDAAALPAIEHSAAQMFRQAPGLEWLANGDVMDQAAHERLIRQGTVWVAVAADDRPVGFLSAEPCADALHIWELSVHADWQRLGLAKQLLHSAATWARAQGWPALSLTTFADLPWNAPAYARQGFALLHTPPPRLQALLDAEAAHGLPAARRVAMWRPL